MIRNFLTGTRLTIWCFITLLASYLAIHFGAIAIAYIALASICLAPSTIALVAQRQQSIRKHYQLLEGSYPTLTAALSWVLLLASIATGVWLALLAKPILLSYGFAVANYSPAISTITWLIATIVGFGLRLWRGHQQERLEDPIAIAMIGKPWWQQCWQAIYFATIYLAPGFFFTALYFQFLPLKIACATIAVAFMGTAFVFPRLADYINADTPIGYLAGYFGATPTPANKHDLNYQAMIAAELHASYCSASESGQQAIISYQPQLSQLKMLSNYSALLLLDTLLSREDSKKLAIQTIKTAAASKSNFARLFSDTIQPLDSRVLERVESKNHSLQRYQIDQEAIRIRLIKFILNNKASFTDQSIVRWLTDRDFYPHQDEHTRERYHAVALQQDNQTPQRSSADPASETSPREVGCGAPSRSPLHTPSSKALPWLDDEEEIGVACSASLCRSASP